jgi:hypothetical protein
MIYTCDLEGIRRLYLTLYAPWGKAEALARFAQRVRELAEARPLPAPNWRPITPRP